MWIAEKFQSNPEIAGSPRNSFRAEYPRGRRSLPKVIKLRMPLWKSMAVRLYEISWTVERETAQTCS